jgi:hypothetical protein
MPEPAEKSGPLPAAPNLLYLFDNLICSRKIGL